MMAFMKNYITFPQHGFVFTSDPIKGSRFIGIVFQVSDVATVGVCLDQVATRYPDVTHACYAYKIGDKQKSSDAGEPAGTAGKPILHAIAQSGYDHVLVVVLRYFGGTLLGAGGLMRAYGQCARDVLTHVPVERKELLQEISVACSYDDMSIVMQCVDICQGKIVSQDAGVLLHIVCAINRGLVAQFMDVVKDKSGGRVEIIIHDKWLMS